MGRAGRREAAKQEILEACWTLAAEHGLSGFTVRQVASAVGIRAPSLYSYFDSKNAMYDAMFRAAAEAFVDAIAQVPAVGTPLDRLRDAGRAYVQFCVDDPVRHQLLFQRAVPGFHPSPDAFAPAIAAYELMRGEFAELGIHDSRHLDLWTAVVSGLASQQLANDLGGSRWLDLVDDAARMFLRQVRSDAQ